MPTSTGSVPFTCFGCGQPGHKIAECPVKNGTPPASTQTRQTATPAAPRKNIAGAVRSRLNHMTAEDTQDAPNVVYDMFLVQGVIASVLFDSRATCSYISTKFAREHNIPVTPRKEPIDTSSSLGRIICTKRCQGVSITIEGYPFLADLTLLPSEGLDVILGMDWLTQHKGVISCSPRYVEITHPSGPIMRCKPN
jgi:hypothetical protein